MIEKVLADLLAALDIVILERLDVTGTFRVIGTRPAWVAHFVSESDASDQCVHPAESFPFLSNFLEEAEEKWARKHAIPSRSGAWSEVTSAGEEYHFEATAVSTHDNDLLLIQRLGSEYLEWHTILQKARERNLQHRRETVEHVQTEARLGGMLDESEKIRDDLLSILNQLSLATVMTDVDGTVTFLSDAAQRLLDSGTTEVAGRSWYESCPFSKSERLALRTMANRAASERSKVQVHLSTTAHRRYAIDIDVQDDPRNPQRKIFFLYDTTEIHDLRRLLKEQGQFFDLVGQSGSMHKVFERVREVAGVDATVLIAGETGTGKELVARAIHASSPRAQHPFIAVNCAGLTESLLGSQLFGHKRGAFTGATEDHRGFFEAAQGGTIFLDEIGDMPMTTQANLLRVLQEKEITRLGESKPRRVDARILAATNQRLSEQVTAGKFRADLLYRIRVARIDLPPLRTRREDIPLLVTSFLSQAALTSGKTVEQVSTDAMQRLLRYSWPGNVRELKSAIDFAVIHCPGNVIRVSDLPPELLSGDDPLPTDLSTLADERDRVLAALEKTEGNRAAAARLLGVSRATLYRRLTSLNIPAEP